MSNRLLEPLNSAPASCQSSNMQAQSGQKMWPIALYSRCSTKCASAYDLVLVCKQAPTAERPK
eukprot:2252251-Amphidinium_carterae.2